VKSAVLFTGGKAQAPGQLSASAAALARDVLRAMSRRGPRWVAALVLALLLLGGAGAGLFAAAYGLDILLPGGNGSQPQDCLPQSPPEAPPGGEVDQ
jgi:hypothetical protein